MIRDEWRCRDCDLGAHHVHHIKPITTIQRYDRELFRAASSPDNLVALCRNCHSLRHGDRPPKNYKNKLEAWAELLP